MKITYYKSRLCPKCIPTNHLVTRLRREHPDIEIEEIEVLTNLPRALRDGIVTLPTLLVDGQRFHRARDVDTLVSALGSGSLV